MAANNTNQMSLLSSLCLSLSPSLSVRVMQQSEVDSETQFTVSKRVTVSRQ